MKSISNAAGKILVGIVLLLVAGGATWAAPPVERPLSPDDVSLLLLASSSSEKVIQVIEQRGIDFQMTPDLARKFHDLGAADAVIDALQRAGSKAATPAATAPAEAATAKPNAPETAEPPAAETPRSGHDVSATPPAAPPAKETPAAAPAEPVSAAEQKIQGTVTRLTSTTDAPQAPILRLQDINGRKYGPDDFKGKVVLVNYWGTWCPPCRAEVASLVRLQGMYRAEGLQVVGIAVDDTARKVREFARENGINYPVVVGDAALKTLFGDLGGVPTSFLIGRDGRVYQRVNGAPMDVKVFEQGINALLKTPATENAQVASAPPPAPPAPAKSDPSPAAAPAQTAPAPAAGAKPDAPPVPTASAPGLKDPSPEETQHIIQEFAAKEKVFRAARDNYTYHQINKVEELGNDNEIVGTFQQEWDILYNDNGSRIEHVTYAPTPSLKGLIVTKEDMENFRNIQPFVLTTDELPEYDVKYLGHVKVDQITAYVFSVRPKEIQKNRLYFQGVVWVDDRDLQIVKSEGKTVPELRGKHGQNLFPRFTTWREQIDGKFWFPTYTMADDTLYFENGPPVHMKEIVRYTDYKQFKSGTRILSVEGLDKLKDQSSTPAPATK